MLIHLMWVFRFKYFAVFVIKPSTCVCVLPFLLCGGLFISAWIDYLRDSHGLHTCCVNSLHSSSLKVIFLTQWPRLNTYANCIMFVCVSPVSPPDNRCGPWNRKDIWISFDCLLRVRRFSNCLILWPYFTYSDTAFFGRGLTLTHYGSVLLKG